MQATCSCNSKVYTDMDRINPISCSLSYKAMPKEIDYELATRLCISILSIGLHLFFLGLMLPKSLKEVESFGP